MKGLKRLCAIICCTALVAGLCQMPMVASAATKNTSHETATVVKLNAKKTGTITTDEDNTLYYYFTTTAEQAYYEVSASTSVKDVDFDILVEDEDEVTQDSMSISSEESGKMVFELEKNKKYYIVVSANVEKNSSFNFEVKKIVDDFANKIEDATMVTLGSNIEGTIEVKNDIDYLKFKTVEQNVYYQFEVINTSINDDIILDVQNEDGLSEDSVTVEPKSSGKTVKLLEKGKNYYMQINTYGAEEIGNYKIIVTMQYDTEEDEIENASAIMLNQTVRGMLQSETDIDCFRFTSKKGEVSHQIQFALDAKENASASLELLDKDEMNIESILITGSEKEKITVELEETGTYYIRISGDIGGITYVFSVSPTSQAVDITDTSTKENEQTTSTPYNLSQGKQLTLGKKYDGLIEKAGDAALLYFNTTKRGYYEITYYDAWIEGNMVADLSDANGKFIRKIYLSKSQTANKLYELNAKSPYCVKIYSEDGQGYGTYSVEVNFKLETKDNTASTSDSTSTSQTTVVSPTKFKLSSQSVKLKKGKKKTIKVVYSPKAAKIQKATWKSANSKIAKVTQKGVITAVKKGKTTISCKVVFTDGTKRTLSLPVKVV